MDDRLVVYGPGPERSWSTMASPLSSVKPKTGNTSVAWGRALRQHNVWHRLTQMLCRDVALTFATFWGRNTSILVCSAEGSLTINKKLLSERRTVCYPEQQGLTSGRNDVVKLLLRNKVPHFLYMLFSSSTQFIIQKRNYSWKSFPYTLFVLEQLLKTLANTP